jgi:hypothetical protein
MMQKVNVGHSKRKMDKLVSRKALPCIRRLRLLYRERVVRDEMPMSMARKKVMKKQRRGKK